MALTTLNTTKRFVIQYDPIAYPNFIKRAQALLDVAEQELDILSQWFGVHDGFGPQNPIYAKAASPPRYGAQNGGYVPAPVPAGVDPMWINHDAQEDVVDDSLAAERVKALFVAELAEILMAYVNYRQGRVTWNRLGSNGEGLSRFCAVIRYPAGYYSYMSPAVNSWLQLQDRESMKKDFVTKTERTDVNSQSYGCAVLFLFYLRSQLGFSESQIIQSGGATLADTYQSLTGGSGTDAFNSFTQLLRPFFPLGKTPPLLTEDPFPLQDASFDVTIAEDHFESDGCGHRYLAVGSSVTFTALVGNLKSIYPAVGTTFRWDPPIGGHVVGSSEGKSAVVSVDSPGVLNVTVQVTVTTATESATRQGSIQFTALTPLEGGFWKAWCHYWQETRFIPQPIPIGDPATHIFQDRQLRELGIVLERHIRGAVALKDAVAGVIRQREAQGAAGNRDAIR